MPHIKFKGKNLVVNHHLVAPYHALIPRRDLSVIAKNENLSLHDNLILHGDNLLALKSLLPTHSGKINCIYIDPPYNTGNENWSYNDNVKNPMIQAWLGKVVDKEDLTRHDKWLCMMYPRLTLLYELLAEDGVIFISIDDNEVHRLRMLMDEVFGEDNFVANITVENDSRARQYDIVATTHEYVFCYAKNKTRFSGNILEDQNKKFKYEDKEGGFDLYELRNRNTSFNIDNRPNLYYPFYVNPKNNDNGLFEVGLTKKTGWVEVYPQESQGVKTVWRWQPETAKKHLNTILFARKAKHGFQVVKKYRGINYTLNSVWTNKEIKTDKGTLEIKEIFGNKIFDYPKPVNLLSQLFKLVAQEDSIILDSFAGSGTTAHAVMQLNSEDGGNRKFILVESEDYANKITAERIRRVISGVKGAKDATLQKGLGGSFSYFELGKAVEIRNILEQKFLPSYEELARYIFFTATGEQWNEKGMRRKKNYIGESRDYEIYLLYTDTLAELKETALTLDGADAIPASKSGKVRLIFAPVRYINIDELDKRKMKFCQLPFEIYKMVKSQEQ